MKKWKKYGKFFSTFNVIFKVVKMTILYGKMSKSLVSLQETVQNCIARLMTYTIQLLTSNYKRLVNRSYVNGVTLRGQNPPLKYCQPLERLTYFERGFRSFNTGNMESAGQRAAKLPSFKLWEWFNPSCTWTRAKRNCKHFGCNGRIGRLLAETSNFDSL